MSNFHCDNGGNESSNSYEDIRVTRLQRHNEFILCDVRPSAALDPSVCYLRSTLSSAGVKRRGSGLRFQLSRIPARFLTETGLVTPLSPTSTGSAVASGGVSSSDDRRWPALLSVSVATRPCRHRHAWDCRAGKFHILSPRVPILPASAGRHQKAFDAPPGNMQSTAGDSAASAYKNADQFGADIPKGR